MRFPDFYGNEGLKLRLTSAGDRLSHCYILEGPAGSGKKTLARLLAAAMECQSAEARPCLKCAACRKVMKGEHPDVITVDSDRATVPIAKIREMQADAYIKPNEGVRKIYIIPRAQDMQGPAQNALLKLLEEPPAYCAFLLLTDSMKKLLGTVRSRAVALSLSPLSRQQLLEILALRRPDASREALARAAERSEGYLGPALDSLDRPETEQEITCGEIAAAFASGDELRLYTALLSLEKSKQAELLPLLSELHRMLIRAMDTGTVHTGAVQQLADHCSPRQLYGGAQAVSRAIELLQANGSAGHAIGTLMARMRAN